MTRLIVLALAMLPLSQSAVPPNSPVVVARVWTISWRDAFDWQGRVSQVPVFALGDDANRPPERSRVTAPRQLGTVAWLDERLREARLAGDVAALDRILSDLFYEVDQDGSGRTKAAAIRALGGSKLDSLTATRLTARAADNAVSITGEQTLIIGSRTERTLFTHVYVREPTDEWKLLSSTAVRTNP